LRPVSGVRKASPASEDLPFSVHLIASICIIHNFPIDAGDTVPEADVLRAAAERNGGVAKKSGALDQP
jgi:hypothetical protein